MAAEMIFHDETGRVMSRDEVIAAGMGHLLDDAPVFRCSGCGRKSADPEVRGWKCGMRQPNGTRCPGVFC